MLRLKKIISILLLVVTIITVLPRNAFALSISAPSQNVTSSKYFTALPGVYEMGDGYAVIWATNFKGTGYIQYKYNGTTYTVYDMKNGIVRTGDTIHVVKVPYAHLQGNSYTVYSTEVTSHSYALTNYGTTVSAGPIKLKAYDGGSDFDILVLTDTHGKKDWTVDVAAKFSGDPDLVVFSGDIEDKLDQKSDIANMFNIMGTTTGGRYPIVYCRGNHEIRDVYSTALLEYFPTETGEFYFDFTYGPLWAVVMDNGEDKVDTHEYYGNLANFKEYNGKQEAWLRSLRPNPNATYRLSINHIPDIYNLPNNVDLSDSVGHLGIQFAVSGHKHWSELYSVTRADYRAKLGYETLICGGYGANIAAWLKMSGSNAYITTKRGNNVTTTNTSSANASHHVDFNNYKVPLSKNKTSNPAALAEPDYGTNNLFNPSVASKGTVTLATQPAVFESGGDWYNVVWKTSDSGSAKGVTGYVEYTYNGKTYQQFDEVGGYRRTCDDFHTVKVPKAHLNNNTYRVGSFLMEYGSTSTGGRYYTSGDWVESQTYLFENKTDDAAVSLISCPDLELNSDSKRLTNAKNAVAGLGTSPAYVVMNGNAAAVALYGGDELTYLLNAAATVSGSIHPVILSRGFTECRGATAANLLKYIPTATGEFYYTVDVGDYTLVNLDTAEDQPDNATAVVSGKTVSKYGNRVFFDSYRKTQLSWINSLPGGKLVALSSTPLSEVNSVFGLNYESALKNKGAVLAISGHSGSFSVDSTVNGSNIYTVTPGGRSDSNGTDVVSVLLSENYAYITDCKSNNGTTTCPTKMAVSLSSGSTLSQSTSQPPLVNGVYEVSTAAHLRWISANCTSATSFSGKTFRLVNNIDMQLVPFTPIGGNDTVSSDENTTSAGFAGTFDGNGYAVKNLNIHSPDKNNVGFFGLVRQGTVKNLTVSGGTVSGNWYVGGLVGATYKGSLLQDCYSDLTVSSAAGTKIGGITGFLSGGSKINRCGNYGSVSGGHASGSAGGIVGQIVGATTNTINSCFNTGSIATHGAKGNAGGIFGYAGNVGAAITNCYNAAPVTSCGSAGAIMSSYSSSSKITVSNTYFAKGYNGATTATKSSNSWSNASGSGTISGKSQSSMKSQSFANTLGSGDFVYDAASNNGYPIHNNGGCTHTYSQTGVAPTCTTAGYTTYTCSKCGDSYTENLPTASHSFSGGKCAVCGVMDSSYSPDYYLFGYINGANYACEEDYQNLGKYRFVGGKLTATFDSDSYVAVKTGDNANWYMTNGWLGDATAATLYNSGINADPNKLFVPGGVEVTFTLVNNGDDTLTLSYVVKECSHSYTGTVTRYPTCTTSGEKTYTCSQCGHSYTESVAATGHSFSGGKCSLCGAVDTGYKVDYYLFGFINGANYACEEDNENLGIYQFVNGKLTATFEQDSYVGVKTADNVNWYMTDGWRGEVTSAVLYNTSINANPDKLFVPGGCEVTFTLKDNGDDTLTLSYVAAQCSHSYTSKTTTAATCTENGVKTYTCSQCGHSYTETVPAAGHQYVSGKCSVCGIADRSGEYYLFGYINGADYGIGEDQSNLGEYKFVDGKVTVTFTEDSYVAVKTGDNLSWYMTNGWIGEATSATMYKFTDPYAVSANKLLVSGGQTVTFTLEENWDGNLKLSYTVQAGSCNHASHNMSGICDLCGAAVEHSFSNGICTVCGLPDDSFDAFDYYLFGFINGSNYAYEEDYANLGEYKFTDGKLTATFEQDSYVGVKKTYPNGKFGLEVLGWYMTDGWRGEVTSAVLYNTSINANPDKLYVPGGCEVTFTLKDNGDDTLTLSYVAAQCSHSYTSKTTTAATCTENGVKTYTCSQCGHSYTETIPAAGHKYVSGKCSVCGIADRSGEYYLFGYINGADYGIGEDQANLGEYKFVNGKVTVTFTEDSYVAVKTGDNASWYMTNGWIGEATSATLYKFTDPYAVSANKLLVSGGQTVTFTLEENWDGNLKLSYTVQAGSCNHASHNMSGICDLCGAAVEHSFSNGICTVCGLPDDSFDAFDYYLFGYINGANYGYEEDYANLGEYKFTDGKLTATFEQDSYVGVKKTYPNGKFGLEVLGWYMTDGWRGEVTSAVLYNTSINANPDKLYVPGGCQVTFTLVENGDDTLTLSYVTAQCSHSYSLTASVAATCLETGSKTYTCSQCGHSYTETIPATGHNYMDGACVHCGQADPNAAPKEYYLFGYINGVDYGFGADQANLGIYKFVDGKVTVTFTADSYVAVKTGDNASWYMTNGWIGEADSATLYKFSDPYAVSANKLLVSGGQTVTFTLEENWDGNLKLSYTVQEDSCKHASHDQAGICDLCGAIVSHNYVHGICDLCGLMDGNYEAYDYYLFGYINGANYGCEEDWANLGFFKFRSIGTCSANFTSDSYVGVKKVNPGTGEVVGWYMTNGWQGTDKTSVTLYNTNALGGNADKLYAPAGVRLTFTLKVNADGTLTLSYADVNCQHTFDGGKVTTAAGCGTEGTITYTCTNCGHYYVETVAAVGHNCAGGKCTICGAKDPNSCCTNHNYSIDYEIMASCGANGSRVFKASCGASYTVTVPATGHSYNSRVTTAATCVLPGLKTYTCSCGDTYSEPITALGHQYQNGFCKVCGAKESSGNITNQTYYLFGYINGADYACGEDWQNMGKFKFVGNQLTAIFDTDSYVAVKTGDNATWYMTESFVSGNSGTFCDTTLGGYEKMFVPGGVSVTFTLVKNADGTLGLSYTTSSAGGSVILPNFTLKYPSMSFKDEVKLNVYFDVTDTDSVVDMGLIVFSSKMDSYTVFNAEDVVAGYQFSNSAGLYCVSTNGIPAKNMGDTVWFAVYAQLSNGTYTYSKLVDYSPRTYAYTMLGSGDAKLDALLVAMLNYGTAAQTYFGYNTGSLLNNQLTAAQQALVTAYSKTMMPDITAPSAYKQGSFVANGGFEDKYPSVTFGGAFAINYYCVPSYLPASSVTMYYWREADYNAASVLTAENATGSVKMSGGGTYRASVTGISAKDISDGVYVAFVYSDGTTTYSSGVLPYSIGMYCTTMAGYQNDFTPFAQATAVYGYYAKQYFG